MWDLKEHIDNIAVIQESGAVVTYGELLEHSNDLTEKMPERSLVVCLCKNSIGSLLGYVAFLNAKIVPLMLDGGVDKELLGSLIEVYKPEYFWVPSEMTGHFDSCVSIYSDFDFTLLKNLFGQRHVLHNELALLLTTSGSTGSRKLVRQSYQNLRSNTKSIVEYLEINQKERSITTLPMSYTYGLSIINSHLYAGASVITTSKTLVQKEFWHQLKTYNATSFGGVPFTYEMLNKLKFFKMDLPSIKVMTQAGGRLTADLHKKFSTYVKETGKRFYVMYGQTEATARMSYLPYENSLEKYGSIGIAIPDGKFFLVDEENNKITDCDTVGELGYIGENVTLGYAEDCKDLTKGDERQGVLLTGDMAKVDEDGFYWVVGRKKRFLKIFGNRINLDETEELLKTRFSDVDLACSGVDDNLYIYVTDNKIINDVRQYLSDKTGLNHISITVNYINEIPKNESGKTAYKDLSNLL
jgi:long-chain acyl-CoA synthetase